MSDTAMAGVSNVSPQSVGMQIGVAMLKKQQDVMEMQGQSMVKLVESMPDTKPVGNLGNNIDVMA
jgi:hypothetical protein